MIDEPSSSTKPVIARVNPSRKALAKNSSAQTTEMIARIVSPGRSALTSL